MKLSEFSYRLPPELIAQQPLKDRDAARLLVVDRKTQAISHSVFSDLKKFFPEKSLIVLNDSKVVPARLLGRRATGAEVEIFLLKRLRMSKNTHPGTCLPAGRVGKAVENCLPREWVYQAMVRPLGRIKPGEKILFDNGKIGAEVKDFEQKIVSFNVDIEKHLNRIGHMPLPPYIKRPDTASDKKFYQTVYAKNPGSVAAPTAGLHFTSDLLTNLKREGHTLATVTLHVNQATFKPVEAETIEDHPMHWEDYFLSVSAARSVNSAKKKGRPIVAVGTTSCRVLETFAEDKKLKGATNLFIYPGYRFKMTDILVTNFHLPASTLLMLVYAFGGTELMKRAYREAIEKKYRFYSYGDGMLIK